MLLAGREAGTTARPSSHFEFPEETPMTNLPVSLLDYFVGVHAETLGDSTGKLDGRTAIG